MAGNSITKMIIPAAVTAAAAAAVVFTMNSGSTKALGQKETPKIVPQDVATCYVTQNDKGSTKALIRKAPEEGERHGKLMYIFHDTAGLFADRNEGVAAIPRGSGGGARFQEVGEFVVDKSDGFCDVRVDGRKPERFVVALRSI